MQLVMRLRSVELPDERSAVVGFDLMAGGYVQGDEDRILTRLHQEAPRIPETGPVEWISRRLLDGPPTGYPRTSGRSHQR